MFKWFAGILSSLDKFRKDMHQVELEAFIATRAKHAGDVDRLVREFEARSRMF